jgi:hypothetical protein
LVVVSSKVTRGGSHNDFLELTVDARYVDDPPVRVEHLHVVVDDHAERQEVVVHRNVQEPHKEVDPVTPVPAQHAVLGPLELHHNKLDFLALDVLLVVLPDLVELFLDLNLLSKGDELDLLRFLRLGLLWVVRRLEFFDVLLNGGLWNNWGLDVGGANILFGTCLVCIDNIVV